MGRRLLRTEVSWLVHALGFGANPLRRGVDRLTALATVVVAVLAMLTVPICATVATGVQDQQTAEVARQVATRHQVVAVLREDAKIGSEDSDPASLNANSTAWVEWRDEHGAPRDAVASVPANGLRGSTTTVWVDDSGRVTEKPRSQASVTISTVLLVSWLLMVVELGLWAIAHGIRRLGYAYAARAWEREWAVIERHWKWPQY